jgi:hypothetical protein
MAYNRHNLLLRIIEIQDITLSEKQRGSSQTWIYENLIRERFHISKSTYDRYLGLPARRQYKQLNNKE